MSHRRCDDCYADEFQAAQAQGLQCGLISFEDLQNGRLRVTPQIGEHERVLYRGWMLRADEYRCLVQLIEDQGALCLVSLDDYLACHHLPHWYRLCQDLTAQTRILAVDDDFNAELSGLDWPGFFVKDYVKSLNTGGGSVAKDATEIAAIVSDLSKFRGQIEGGICVRRLERYDEASECRFFVVDGKPFAADGGDVPALVRTVASRISRLFYSVDIVNDLSGAMRLVEVGDGQVSDRKHWTPEQFARVLVALNRTAPAKPPELNTDK